VVLLSGGGVIELIQNKVSPMKRVLASLLTMSFAVPASADPTLVGEWRSDRELTMNFIERNVKLEEKTYKFLSDMMGRLTLTFTRDRVRSVLPDWDTSIEGRARQMVGFGDEAPYRVLYANERVIVISGAEPVTHQETVTTFNFDGPDTMWIYTGGSDKALPQSHYREYFRRVR
jgi:hypothetical protein